MEGISQRPFYLGDLKASERDCLWPDKILKPFLEKRDVASKLKRPLILISFFISSMVHRLKADQARRTLLAGVAKHFIKVLGKMITGIEAEHQETCCFEGRVRKDNTLKEQRRPAQVNVLQFPKEGPFRQRVAQSRESERQGQRIHSGHMRKDCPNHIYRKCHQIGHNASECTAPPVPERRPARNRPKGSQRLKKMLPPTQLIQRHYRARATEIGWPSMVYQSLSRYAMYTWLSVGTVKLHEQNACCKYLIQKRRSIESANIACSMVRTNVLLGEKYILLRRPFRYQRRSRRAQKE